MSKCLVCGKPGTTNHSLKAVAPFCTFHLTLLQEGEERSREAHLRLLPAAERADRKHAVRGRLGTLQKTH